MYPQSTFFLFLVQARERKTSNAIGTTRRNTLRIEGEIQLFLRIVFLQLFFKCGVGVDEIISSCLLLLPAEYTS
jgi:hypothetical protein